MIYKRQRLLFQAIKLLSEKGISSKTYLVKALFLLRQRFGFSAVGYDFFPYKYGPFSNEIYWDLNRFQKDELFDKKSMRLTEKGEELARQFDNKNIIAELGKMTVDFPDRNRLLNFVYGNYRDFTVRSEKLPHAKQSGSGVYSIGYEGKTIDSFLNELIQKDISLVADVRRNAFSMKKGFSKKLLALCLENAGIKYLHFPELGIESEKRKNLQSEKEYKKLFNEYKESLASKKDKIEEIESLGKKQKIALMCFEANKNNCHRGTLSEYLNKEVVHI